MFISTRVDIGEEKVPDNCTLRDYGTFEIFPFFFMQALTSPGTVNIKLTLSGCTFTKVANSSELIYITAIEEFTARASHVFPCLY